MTNKPNKTPLTKPSLPKQSFSLVLRALKKLKQRGKEEKRKSEADRKGSREAAEGETQRERDIEADTKQTKNNNN